MKWLQGHADLRKAEFGLSCTMREDIVLYFCAHLSKVCLGLEMAVPTASSARCQTVGCISCSTRPEVERSLSSTAAPRCTTLQKMPLFSPIPVTPTIWIFSEDWWQHFTRLLWGGSSCSSKQKANRQTLTPRPWCQPVTPALPASELLKPTANLINLTMENRGIWSLFCSVKTEMKVRATCRTATLGCTCFPTTSQEAGVRCRGVQSQLCSVRASMSQNCFSFSIFAMGVATNVQLRKALWDLLIRSIYETNVFILLSMFSALPKTAGSPQGR